MDNNLLTIRGNPARAAPGQLGIHVVKFFRQFELNDKGDQNEISGTLKHGVLALSLAKAEEAKPRKIEVKAD